MGKTFFIFFLFLCVCGVNFFLLSLSAVKDWSKTNSYLNKKKKKTTNTRTSTLRTEPIVFGIDPSHQFSGVRKRRQAGGEEPKHRAHEREHHEREHRRQSPQWNARTLARLGQDNL